jgi:HPt (histidine-containing phosphotransfer) domain-containing protein
MLKVTAFEGAIMPARVDAAEHLGGDDGIGLQALVDGPAIDGPAIDLAHLARMTLGDSNLEAEVLGLFQRQAELLLARMTSAPPAATAAFAHTLKGSARGIGAWRVAAAAQAVEVGSGCPDTGQELDRLIAAVREVEETIAKVRAGR